ncbi:PAS domain-containing protein [Polynucleobacter sp. AP-Kolm-20A-A1]|uniref:PAS domain-containing protein n=1 Tax=Polynucleobacter sp. AP-Kolm-20A-A1 TaxID=2081041 RepID=UPI00203C64A8|nr:PAS domain-containing protein [Polynucleobacter sp. AP-Kolm-20A-A1]QWE21448.1 PAS domain-containing protein [Polynucleobacter sp. AP-Kolm-20A-A1]
MPKSNNLKRILVIDDNPAIYEDFCKVLCPTTAPAKELTDLTNSIFGDARKKVDVGDYQIDFALRGQDGVEKVKAAINEGRPYIIAFVDMRMPNGWGGLETIKNLWLAQPQLQIVLCTAYSDYSWDEIRAQLSRRDRFLILKKPFDNIEVQQMVETLINRQESEELLLENKNLLQTAQEIAKVGHYTLNQASQKVDRSESLNSLFQIPPDYGTSYDEFCKLFSPHSEIHFNQCVQGASKNQKPFEIICQFHKGDLGQYAWCIAAGYWELDVSNKPVKLIGTIQDITQTYELQNQLRLLDACISQADDVVIITDSRQKTAGGPRIVYVNDIFERKTGYSKEFAIGKTMDILYGPNTQESAIEKINKGLINKKPVRVEMVNYDANKAEFWVDLNMSPIQDKDDEITHWLCMQRDISNQKTTLDALTDKEFSVVKAVASNSEITLKEIADRLHISEHTLRNHLASIYEKLGVRGRLELYIFCSKFMDELSKS